MEPRYTKPSFRYRILFSDGKVFDCISTEDNGDFRSWALEQNGYKAKSDVKILGVAKLEQFKDGEVDE